MGSRYQSGQVLIDTLITFIFFAGLFIALQAIMDHHKERTNKHKISQEVSYDIHPQFKK